MFTVGETLPISDANEREQQTQQGWIQYVAGNPLPRTFTTETPFRMGTATSNSARAMKPDKDKKPRSRENIA